MPSLELGGGDRSDSGPSGPSTFTLTLQRSVLQHNATGLNITEGTASVTVGTDTHTVSNLESSITISVEAGTTITLEAFASQVVIAAQLPPLFAIPPAGQLSLPVIQNRAVFINWDGIPSDAALSGVTLAVDAYIDMNVSFDMPASNLTITANFFPDLFVMRANHEINRFHPNLVNNGHPADLIIPASINGHALTHIGHGAFMFTVFNLTNVQFSSRLIHIGNQAFQNNHLVDVFIPNSVTNIGGSAFGIGFAALALGPTLIFEDGTQPLTIGTNAFANNHGITEIDIPARISSIGSGAFVTMNNLTTVIIRPRPSPIPDMTGRIDNIFAFPTSFEDAFNSPPAALVNGAGVYTRPVGGQWSWTGFP